MSSVPPWRSKEIAQFIRLLKLFPKDDPISNDCNFETKFCVSFVDSKVSEILRDLQRWLSAFRVSWPSYLETDPYNSLVRLVWSNGCLINIYRDVIDVCAGGVSYRVPLAVVSSELPLIVSG